jgi:hypothetical protein
MDKNVEYIVQADEKLAGWAKIIDQCPSINEGHSTIPFCVIASNGGILSPIFGNAIVVSLCNYPYKINGNDTNYSNFLPKT